MIRLKETIIVEGIYDKIKLAEIVDAPILTVGGFTVFKDEKMQNLLRKLAQTTGIIIFTDSDRAGFKIRNFIKNICVGEKCRIYHAYIPEISGKEKRKSHPGKDGLLGVEGIAVSAIENAILSCGIKESVNKSKKLQITKADLFRAGLTGGNESKIKRENFLKEHNLPTRISTNMLLEIIACLGLEEEIFQMFS